MSKTATLRFVLGDQLSHSLSALEGLNPARDVVLMVEARAEATYVPHHPQKIILILSAMRHFAEELRVKGCRVEYIKMDDPANTGSFAGELARAVAKHKPNNIVCTFPGEWRVWEDMQSWQKTLGVPVEVREDTRFFSSRADFATHCKGRKQLRMEFFYREQRAKHNLLMDKGKPVGGEWNYDAENRKALPKDLPIPPAISFTPDKTTKDVIALVKQHFGSHFGEAEPFGWAVTAADAERALDYFIRVLLRNFGDYEDAMKRGEDTLFHSVLSPYLNCGLLLPREVCARAEAAYRSGAAPLNAVEGFIRQILGWREFIRGIYWQMMPAYATSNALAAKRPLPAFYWDAKTEMACLHHTIDQTRRRAYAHHIQRLMVTGNFALIAGIAPAEVEAWYLAVYADAYEWVELPNTHGMVLWADGGVLGSKPYAASGKYINRMSDYCKGCRYDVQKTTGEDACPFNFLYWNFLIENEAKLRSNARMKLIYSSLDRMSSGDQAAVQKQAKQFLEDLSA